MCFFPKLNSPTKYTAMHFKTKSQMSYIFLLILYNSDMLISNMLVKFGHHIRISQKSNYKFIQFFNSIKIFSLQYSGKKANNKVYNSLLC